jgi:hypothetical protein
VPVRSRGLVLLAGVGISIMLTSCSTSGAGQSATSATASASHSASASATPAASSAAQTTSAAIPAGYKRIGGSAQGISLAVPASWVEVNLATQTIQEAASQLDVTGISDSALVQDMESLQKQHAIFAADIASAVSDPDHFARNISAYCMSSGVTEAGSAGLPFLEAVAKDELSTIGSHVTQKQVEIGGVPGVETSYQLTTKSDGIVDGSQLEVLPKPDKACIVSLGVDSSESQGNILTMAAATAQYY